MERWGPHCGAWLLALAMTVGAQADDRQSYDDLDHPMQSSPDLTIPPPLHRFDSRLARLWTDALAAPEVDIRRRAAETMVQAKRTGMEGLEVAIPALAKLAGQATEAPLARLAALRALVALDAQDEAEALFETARALGPDAEAVTMDALIRWKYEPARDLWRARVTQPGSSHRELLIAINGLAGLEDAATNDYLTSIVRDRFASFDLRLAAARSLARSERSGLESLSGELAAAAAPRRHQLLAATLLRYHEGSEAEDLLEALSLNPEPTVAGVALERLIEIAPDRIVTHHGTLLQSRDANVRRWAVKALALFPMAEHAGPLARIAFDPNPGLRVLARDVLLDYALQHDLREPVLQEAENLLLLNDWRAMEQGCRIVGNLDHEPVATELLKILHEPRIEAHATAAWALRKLAVPETLPHVLNYAEETADKAMREFRSGALSRDYDPQLTQIFEFFGEMQYRPATPVLKRFIPKLSMTVPSRCTAIWALGCVYDDDAQPDLVAALEARIKDVGVSLPETEFVRCQCAVALGRMNATMALPTLRYFYEQDGSYTPAGYGCGWAIQEMTGELVDKPLAPIEYYQGFFLMPVK